MKNNLKPAFIAKEYTASFAVRFLGIALFSFTLCGISLFLVLNRRLGVNYSQDIAALSGLQEKLPLIILTSSIIQAVILSLILFLLALMWAHAISGPLVRFRKFISLVGNDGPDGEIAFLENYQLHDLAQAFQKMQAGSQKRRKKFDEYLDNADQLLKTPDSLSKNKRADLEECYQKMGSLLRGEGHR